MTTATEGGVTRVHEADALVDPILRAEPRRGERMKVETLEWRLKALLPCFCLSPYFSPRLDPLLVFDGLTVLRLRGTRNTGYVWISPDTA